MHVDCFDIWTTMIVQRVMLVHVFVVYFGQICEFFDENVRIDQMTKFWRFQQHGTNACTLSVGNWYNNSGHERTIFGYIAPCAKSTNLQGNDLANHTIHFSSWPPRVAHSIFTIPTHFYDQCCSFVLREHDFIHRLCWNWILGSVELATWRKCSATLGK